MFQFVLIFIVITFLFFRNYAKKKNLLAPSAVVLGLFLVSIVLAFPYLIVYNKVDVFYSKYMEEAIFFIFLFFLFIVPFCSYNEVKKNFIVLPNLKILDLFSYFVLFLSIFSVFYFIPTTIKAFTSPDIGAARAAMVGEGELIVAPTIFNTIAGTAASFYQLPMILFFLYEILQKKKIMKYLLLISSFSYVFFVFSYYGRDGVLFWFISFLGLLGFFKSFLSPLFLKGIFKYLLVYFIFAFSGFLIISYSRFGNQTFESLISYMGQPIPNFILADAADAPILNGRIFPLFRGFIGLPEQPDIGLQTYFLESKGIYIWTFGTFLKNFLLSVGVIGTLTIGLMASLAFRSIFKNSQEILFSGILLYFLYFQIFTQGIFYFRQLTRAGNLVIVGQVVLALVFYFIIKYGKKHYLEKISS